MNPVTAQRISSRHYDARVKLFALFCSIFIALLLGECILRVLGIPKDDFVYLKKDGSIEWDCYSSNPRGYFTPRKTNDGQIIYCVDNSHSPPREIDLNNPKYKSAFKVVTVGDSFTYGLGVKVEHGFPYLLGHLLGARRETAVNNVAQVGRNVGEVIEEMKQALNKAPADLCIYGYCLNDPLADVINGTPAIRPAYRAPGMDSDTIYDGINFRVANLRRYQIESVFGPVRSYSRILDLTLRHFEWKQIEAGFVGSHKDLYDAKKNPDGVALTWNTIDRMNQLQTAKGKRFLVVIFPMFVHLDGGYPFEDIHKLIHDKLTELGVDHIDLLPVYRGKPTLSLCVHPVDQHPNEVAHKMAAEAIAKYIYDQPWWK